MGRSGAVLALILRNSVAASALVVVAVALPPRSFFCAAFFCARRVRARCLRGAQASEGCRDAPRRPLAVRPAAGGVAALRACLPSTHGPSLDDPDSRSVFRSCSALRGQRPRHVDRRARDALAVDGDLPPTGQQLLPARRLAYAKRGVGGGGVADFCRGPGFFQPSQAGWFFNLGRARHGRSDTLGVSSLRRTTCTPPTCAGARTWSRSLLPTRSRADPRPPRFVSARSTARETIFFATCRQHTGSASSSTNNTSSPKHQPNSKQQHKQTHRASPTKKKKKKKLAEDRNVRSQKEKSVAGARLVLSSACNTKKKSKNSVARRDSTRITLSRTKMKFRRRARGPNWRLEGGPRRASARQGNSHRKQGSRPGR